MQWKIKSVHLVFLFFNFAEAISERDQFVSLQTIQILRSLYSGNVKQKNT